MDAVIQCRQLGKTFRPHTVAVNGLDLNIAVGEVYGLIGRNGAGKTTAPIASVWFMFLKDNIRPVG